jgi:hypothetical protein
MLFGERVYRIKDVVTMDIQVVYAHRAADKRAVEGE